MAQDIKVFFWNEGLPFIVSHYPYCYNPVVCVCGGGAHVSAFLILTKAAFQPLRV